MYLHEYHPRARYFMVLPGSNLGQVTYPDQVTDVVRSCPLDNITSHAPWPLSQRLHCDIILTPGGRVMK